MRSSSITFRISDYEVKELQLIKEAMAKQQGEANFNLSNAIRYAIHIAANSAREYLGVEE